MLTVTYYYSSEQDEVKYSNFPNQEMKLISKYFNVASLAIEPVQHKEDAHCITNFTA